MIPCGSQIMMSNGEHVQNTRMYGDFAVSVTYCGRMLEVVTHCHMRLCLVRASAAVRHSGSPPYTTPCRRMLNISGIRCCHKHSCLVRACPVYSAFASLHNIVRNDRVMTMMVKTMMVTTKMIMIMAG